MDLSPWEAGYVRAAACSCPVKLAEPLANAAAILDLAQTLSAQAVQLAVFPELGLTGYSLDDLFMQNRLLGDVELALQELARRSASLPLVLVVGAPLRGTHRLYNCAVVIAGGQILGAVPKSYLPNYREFYEHRQFASGVGVADSARVGAVEVAIDTLQLFQIEWAALGGTPAGLAAGGGADGAQPAFTLGVEVCEDLWVPVSPAAEAALAGAEVIANLSGSPITVAKARERQRLCEVQSAKLLAGYVYAAGGVGESSTDLSWDGQTLIYERGELLAESDRFVDGPVATVADLDLALIRQDRIRQGTFDDNRVAFQDRLVGYQRRRAAVPRPAAGGPLKRRLARFP
ncbi:MAG: hypothetical protein LBR19_04640, partial [Bifidobacteriaceae bacterium]|nr:hypothetical protein [Bifidobacteriaceae bacterium]